MILKRILKNSFDLFTSDSFQLCFGRTAKKEKIWVIDGLPCCATCWWDWTQTHVDYYCRSAKERCWSGSRIARCCLVLLQTPCINANRCCYDLLHAELMGVASLFFCLVMPEISQALTLQQPWPSVGIKYCAVGSLWNTLMQSLTIGWY